MSGLGDWLALHWESMFGGLGILVGAWATLRKEKRADKTDAVDSTVKRETAQTDAEQVIHAGFKLVQDQMVAEINRLGNIVASQETKLVSQDATIAAQAEQIRAVQQAQKDQETRHALERKEQDARHETAMQAQRMAHANEIAKRDQQIDGLNAEIVKLRTRIGELEKGIVHE